MRQKGTEPSSRYLFQGRRCGVLYLRLFSQCWWCWVLKLEEREHQSVLYAETSHAAADCCMLTGETVGPECPMQGHNSNHPKTFFARAPTCPGRSGCGFGGGWHWNTLFAGLVCAFVAWSTLAHGVMGAVAVRLILQVCCRGGRGNSS